MGLNPGRVITADNTHHSSDGEPRSASSILWISVLFPSFYPCIYLTHTDINSVHNIKMRHKSVSKTKPSVLYFQLVHHGEIYISIYISYFNYRWGINCKGGQQCFEVHDHIRQREKNR